MVGLGSRIPCIFLKAGMTKRLQVTTADTGLPADTKKEQRDRTKKKKKVLLNKENYQCNGQAPSLKSKTGRIWVCGLSHAGKGLLCNRDRVFGDKERGRGDAVPCSSDRWRIRVFSNGHIKSVQRGALVKVCGS